MAYFSNDNAKGRIHLLYFMQTMDTALTKVQLASAFVENNWIGYFETMLLLDELEEKGLIAAVPCAFGQGYLVTPEGEATLNLFSDQLPLSIKSECNDYARNHGDDLLRMEQFFARAIHSPSGGYDVVLRAFDRDRTLLSLVINLPDLDTAMTVCKNWEEKALHTYSALLNALL